MKKAIKLSIAITLCFAMLFQSIGFAIATTVEDPVWTVYDNGTSKIGTGGTLKTINVTKDETTIYTGEDGDGDGYSYKLDGSSFPNYATIKLTVEPQKYYEVSFNFYATQIGENNSAFSDVIVAKDGAVKQDFSTDYCARVSRYVGYYVNKNSAFVSVPNTTSNFSANAWHSLTVPFYSANNTEVLLAIRPATNGTTVNYIDNIRLKEAEEFAGANDVLSNATTKIYNMTGLTSFANSNLHTGANYTFAKNTTNYTPETDANGDGEVYTMSAACFAQWPSMEMTVEKNQNYELKFKYHASKLDGKNAMFSDIRVVEFGASNAYDSKGNLAAISRDLKTGYLYNKNGVKVDTKINITSGTKTDGWNELTINFYSRNLTKVMLVLRPVVDTAPVSIDDVKLTKVDSFTGSNRMVSDFTVYDDETNLLGKGGTVRPSTWGQSTCAYVNEADYLYTGSDADGDGEAYSFDTLAQWAVAKLALKAKTHYNLTFKYKTDTLDGVRGAFSDVIVLADGKAKNIVTDHLGYIGRGDAYYNNKNGTKIEFTNRVNSNVKANEWNTMTVSFYSGDLTEALLAVRSTVAMVYVDNIRLTEVAKLPSSNLFPSGFTVYNGTGAAENNEKADAAITESTSVVHSDNGDGKSIVLGANCFAQYAVLPMAVEKNKYYTLKFWYYSDSVHPTDNSKVFSHIYVSGAAGDLNTTAIATATTAANGTVNKNGTSITANGFTTAGATAGAWNEVKISFYSGNNKSVRLAVRPATHTDPTKQPSVYLDDITLNNISVSTSYNQKAAIRTADNTDSENIKANGLRTYNAIQADWLSDTEGNIVEYGAIAIRQGYMEKKFEDKTAPDMDMLSLAGQGVGIGVAYRAEGVTTITGSRMMNIHWEKDNADDIFNKHIFTTYLTGIAKANYGEEYLVRSYAIDANGKIYYGETSSISIFKVAQAISNANKAENTYDNEAFKAFVIDSGLADTYAQWCADNSLEVGGLYTSLIAQ